MAKTAGNNLHGYSQVLLLLIVAGTAALMLSPVSAEDGVTIAAYGDQSYYYGEEVILHGTSSVSDTVYLSITGPNLPPGGARLMLPHTASVSGDPGTFTVVKTNPDKTWEYSFYTANILLDAGSFTVSAAGRPETGDPAANGTTGRVKLILKRPFIMADLAPATIRKGEPFMVNGTAEGNPPTVQLWFIGNNSVSGATCLVNPDASFTFKGDTGLSGDLPAGQGYLIVQHSMQNNSFDIIASGDYVRSLQENGMDLFRIHGPGSLQGRDAAEALIAALNDKENGDDTYTVLPFLVEDTEPSGTVAQPDRTPAAPDQPASALLPFALAGIGVLVLGLVMWKRN